MKFIQDALAKRGDDEQGFTLIELLVVVIIIGILAAIAIPVFLNQREKAWDSAVKSDIRNAQTVMETYYTDNSNYGNATAGTFSQVAQATLEANGFSSSDSVTVVVCGTLNEYEIYGVHASYDGNRYFAYDSDGGQLQGPYTAAAAPADCTGAAAGAMAAP